MAHTDDNRPLGARIRSARKALGLTQQQLAEQLAASRYSIVRWETGAAEPDPANREQLAHVLGGSPADYTRAPWERVSPELLEERALREARMNELIGVLTEELGQMKQRMFQLEREFSRRLLQDAAKRMLDAADSPEAWEALRGDARELADALLADEENVHDDAPDLLERLRDQALERSVERVPPKEKGSDNG